MIRWTGLAPWEFEFPFPGSLTSTFLVVDCKVRPWYKFITRWYKRFSLRKHFFTNEFDTAGHCNALGVVR